MRKETLTYTDFEGNERTEDFYFNLTEAECAKLQLGELGGIDKLIDGMIKAQDTPRLAELFEKVLQLSYGVKSPDGRLFIKNEQVLAEFTQTQAYSDLYMELAQNDQHASEFINNVLPKPKNKQAQGPQPVPFK